MFTVIQEIDLPAPPNRSVLDRLSGNRRLPVRKTARSSCVPPGGRTAGAVTSGDDAPGPGVASVRGSHPSLGNDVRQRASCFVLVWEAGRSK
jgi:hypothetical protein